jgi:hypothetical protein
MSGAAHASPFVDPARWPIMLAKSRRVAGWIASMKGSVAKPRSRMAVSRSSSDSRASGDHAAANGELLLVRLSQGEVLAQALRI